MSGETVYVICLRVCVGDITHTVSRGIYSPYAIQIKSYIIGCHQMARGASAIHLELLRQVTRGHIDVAFVSKCLSHFAGIDNTMLCDFTLI